MTRSGRVAVHRHPVQSDFTPHQQRRWALGESGRKGVLWSGSHSSTQLFSRGTPTPARSRPHDAALWARPLRTAPGRGEGTHALANTSHKHDTAHRVPHKSKTTSHKQELRASRVPQRVRTYVRVYWWGGGGPRRVRPGQCARAAAASGHGKRVFESEFEPDRSPRHPYPSGSVIFA